MSEKTKIDERFMARAVELSRHGFPAPNPHVGCVLVKDGEIVGEGFHKRAGEAHAEAVALSQAGPRAAGSTCYVTLEPCNHHGRTPPCSLALIQAGVARVVYAVSDPHPAARGGAQALTEAVVDVNSGVLANEAAAANERFLVSQSNGRPFVTLKLALSLDGFLTRFPGKPTAITGDAARHEVHRLRAEMGAVLVGAGTVRADNPQLTVRTFTPPFQPLRVVLGSKGLTGEERVFNDEAETLWLVKEATHERQTAVQNEDLTTAALRLLSERGINGVLVEGGAKTARAFYQAGLVDALELFYGPEVFGEGTPWASGSMNPNQWRLVCHERLENDAWLSYRPANEH
jgi:diaminohydroxyphosphoribosylaminopyrimidine deaminase/5-amino-6-(5-phosphoribosylamino)uracil reductase